jgi:hypothetical protein
MSHTIALHTGTTHVVSDADAAAISSSMLRVGPLAVNVTLDGSRRVFLAGAAVLMVEPIDDEGDTAP